MSDCNDFINQMAKKLENKLNKKDFNVKISRMKKKKLTNILFICQKIILLNNNRNNDKLLLNKYILLVIYKNHFITFIQRHIIILYTHIHK